jgi:hypothetical protein
MVLDKLYDDKLLRASDLSPQSFLCADPMSYLLA